MYKLLSPLQLGFGSTIYSFCAIAMCAYSGKNHFSIRFESKYVFFALVLLFCAGKRAIQ